MTTFREFVNQMNELFGEPANLNGSPNYPSGDPAPDQYPYKDLSDTKVTISKKKKQFNK